MKKGFVGTAVLLIILTAFSVAGAAEMPKTADQSDTMAKVAQLIDAKGLQNFKQAIELCQSVLKTDPNNFEANWRCAEACREYGQELEHKDVPGWQDNCAKYGKMGMAYAQKAIQLEPNKVNGYFFYGLNVGIYSDGVGLITALREGLKDKTQKNLEKAYELDKDFKKGGPILAIGRFWQVVPFPYTDKDKAMKFYREFEHTKYFADSVEGHIYLAELLKDEGSSFWGGNKNAKKVRELISQVRKLTNDPYWLKEANKIENGL